jgi:hypothetical protein
MRLDLRILRSLCLLLGGANAVGLAGTAPTLPGIVHTARSLSREHLERAQLPPSRTWKALVPDVPSSLNGLRYPEPAGLWAFYGRQRKGDAWITVVRDSRTACASTERATLTVDLRQAPLAGAPAVAWQFYRRGLTIDVAGIKLFELPDCDDWEFFWIDTPQAPEPEKLFPVDLEDGFMRTAFGGADRWEIPGRAWQLKQYGGGMPTTDAEARNPNYRRAANAFTVVGSQGEARNGRNDWTNYLAEARFFFGRPDSFAQRDTLVTTVLGGEPVYRDKEAIYRSNQIHEYPRASFFIVQGNPDGYRVGFGWNADDHCYELRYRVPGSEEWHSLRTWNRRPYFTNWVRLGLGLSRANRALPFVDGDQLGAYELPFVVSGPLALLATGDGKVEIDDVVAESYPRRVGLGTPVFAQSTNFAQKELLETKDVQTGQWTRSQLTFEDDDTRLRAKGFSHNRCQFPLYGDFTYQADPKTPPGDYCLAVVSEQDRPYEVIFVNKNSRGWETPDGGREYALQLGRRNGHLLRRTGDRWLPLINRRVSATVHLVVGAREEAGLAPELHQIYSESLTQELFEKAPTNWAWREGNFRMDVRWQCQRGWNFMMGKSLDLASMFSKTAYLGDQEIEFYIALRFVTPPPYYVLRDMGFAFCTDGRNLGTGYVLVYGDGDNTKTTLLRDGKPVEEVSRTIKNKPGGNIHNYWWHGKVRRAGRLITVAIDDQEIITYRDRDPLPGGHVAFWTRRNAISLAKVSINAETSRPRPHEFQVRPEPIGDGPWRALNPDEVAVKRLGSGRCQVTNRFGGGTFAARWFAPGPGIDLRKTPYATLSLKTDREVKVGLHVEISGRSFYYPLGSGPAGIRGLLTPEYEQRDADPLYRAKPFTEETLKPLLLPGRDNRTEVRLSFRDAIRGMPNPRLTSITVGNASNAGYLLLGAGGNPPDSSYIVGEPQFGQ